jgi:D-threo-aldose 1-dehydrogenase
LIGAGVFNSGILATGTQGGSPHYDYGVASEEVIGRVAAIERCCEQFEVPLPAAALQFAAAHPAVATVVLGTGSPDRIEQTANLMQLPIPNGFWEALRAEGLVSGDCPTPSV